MKYLSPYRPLKFAGPVLEVPVLGGPCSNANSAPHKLNLHGIPARKRSGMYIPGHDLDVKSRAQGFGTIYNWLSDRDVLIIKADYKPPLVVLPPDLAAQLVST